MFQNLIKLIDADFRYICFSFFQHSKLKIHLQDLYQEKTISKKEGSTSRKAEIQNLKEWWLPKIYVKKNNFKTCYEVKLICATSASYYILSLLVSWINGTLAEQEDGVICVITFFNELH